MRRPGGLPLSRSPNALERLMPAWERMRVVESSRSPRPGSRVVPSGFGALARGEQVIYSGRTVEWPTVELALNRTGNLRGRK